MRVPNITPPAQTVKGPDPETVKVAKEFEALFASFMLRAMRNTVNRGGLIPESLGEKIYTDLLDKEYADIMARNASLGLSELILEEIQENENGQSAMQVLRGLNRQPWMVDERFVPRSSYSPGTPARESIASYKTIIEEASAKYGVDADLISAVIAQESAGNPHAVSRAGAKGLMQLVDSTARDMGVRRVFDPRENIHGGTRYLRSMLDRHNGDERLALASYNAGPAAVDRYNGIPPYPETQNYVQNVLRMRHQYASENAKEAQQ